MLHVPHLLLLPTANLSHYDNSKTFEQNLQEYTILQLHLEGQPSF